MTTLMKPGRLRRTARRARDAHEGAMVDTCTIRRAGARGELDPETARYTPADSEVIYSGRCQLLTPDRATVAASEDLVNTAQRTQLKVPADAAVFKIGDVGDVAKFDEAESVTTGRFWRVVGLPPKRWATHQLLEVEEVTAGG